MLCRLSHVFAVIKTIGFFFLSWHNRTKKKTHSWSWKRKSVRVKDRDRDWFMVLRLMSIVTNPLSSYPLADEHAHTQVSPIGQLHKSHQVLIVHHRVYKSEVKGSEPVNQEVHLISLIAALHILLSLLYLMKTDRRKRGQDFKQFCRMYPGTHLHFLFIWLQGIIDVTHNRCVIFTQTCVEDLVEEALD